MPRSPEAKRRKAAKMAALKKEDQSEDLFRLRSLAIQNLVMRGKGIPKKWLDWGGKDLADKVLIHQTVPALALQTKILQRALAPDAKQHEIDRGQKTAESVLNRVIGVPTQRVQVASAVTVHFGDLHPELLPDPGPDWKAQNPKPAKLSGPIVDLPQKTPPASVQDGGNGTGPSDVPAD